MPVTQEQFAELLSIVDAHAGKEHSVNGAVAESLSAVLARYDEMLADQMRKVLQDKETREAQVFHPLGSLPNGCGICAAYMAKDDD